MNNQLPIWNFYKENDVPMSCWAEDDIPSSKLLLKGRAALSDAELLSIIIGNGSSRRQANSLDCARAILQHTNNNLGEVCLLSFTDLIRIGSITKSQAIRIITCFELGKRRGNDSTPSKDRIRTSSDSFAIFQSVLSDKPYEEFWIIMMNKANKFIGKCQISEGGISGTVVDPKKIFKIALDNHASLIILGHNHPSNSTVPSDADKRITEKVVNAGKLLEIIVLDHIIMGDNEYYSFADEGIIQ